MPRGIKGQIVALVVASLLLPLAIAVALVLLLQPPPDPLRRTALAAARVGAIVRALDAAPSESWAGIVEPARRLYPGLAIRHVGTSPEALAEADALTERALDLLGTEIDDADRVYAFEREPGRPDRPRSRDIAVRLRDNGALLAALPVVFPAQGRGLSGPLIVLALAGVTLALLALWATRGLTAPLARFAAAAERFGEALDPTPLRDEGPSELRSAARAFNKMRERIRALVEQRTRMLAAISHDLRTPLTRMRLRAEEIANPELRAQFLRDLGLMESMITSSLAYLRNEDAPEPMTPVDLPSLLQTICDESVELGREVAYEGPSRLAAPGRPEALTRAFTNLIDNAAKYGGSARVALRLTRIGTVEVQIDDDGPGIPESERGRVFDPFYRGDAARSMDGSGFGLGLSIARSIVEAHGGELTLVDREPRGLRVLVKLPAGAGAGAPPGPSRAADEAGATAGDGLASAMVAAS